MSSSSDSYRTLTIYSTIWTSRSRKTSGAPQGRPGPVLAWRFRQSWGAGGPAECGGLVVLAAVSAGALLLPVPPTLVEGWYSNGVYPLIQRSDHGALEPPAVRAVRRGDHGGARPGWSGGPSTIVVPALAGGGRWQGSRSASNGDDRCGRLPLVPGGLGAELSARAAGRASPVRSRGGVRRPTRAPWRVRPRPRSTPCTRRPTPWAGANRSRSTARSSARSTVRRGFGVDTAPLVGRPKTTVLDLYFRRAGVAGMTNPWFLETLIASDLLPFERPFVIAHEWSHLAGLERRRRGELSRVAHHARSRRAGALQRLALPLQPGRRVARRHATASRRQRSLQDGPRAGPRAIAERVRRQVEPGAWPTPGWQGLRPLLEGEPGRSRRPRATRRSCAWCSARGRSG